MQMSTISSPITGGAAEQKKQREKALKALQNARQRCTNLNNKDYKNYGALGIKVLLNLDELIACIGLPKGDVSLDRIDPKGHYEVGNVRWASKAVQAANKKSSPGGSIAPLQTVIAQQQLVIEAEKKRPRVCDAWHLLIKGVNRGTMSDFDRERLVELLNLSKSVWETFGTREIVADGCQQSVFRMPSISLPSSYVRVRGSWKAAPDENLADKHTDRGLLYCLCDIEGGVNIPLVVQRHIESVRKSETSLGLTLVGRPSEADLANGWFEGWMLAAASRLTEVGTKAAFYPALTCIDLLKYLGAPSHWDYVSHHILDIDLLFIPDFQLDCGAWGNLSNYQFAVLERLLRYRAENGHKTVVGIQAHHKLSQSLQKILLGTFDVIEVASGIAPALVLCN